MPPSEVGNGVYVVDLATSQSKVLSSATLDYDQLTWGDKGASLAVLRGDKKKENLQRDNTLLVWQDVSAPPSRAPPSTIRRRTPAFPKAYVVSEIHRAALDARRLARLRRPQGAGSRQGAGADAEPQANVDVWHWKDDEVQSVQIVRLRAGAARHAARGVQRRERQARAHRRRRDAQRHADARSEVGDRPHRHDVSRRSAVGRQRRRTTIASAPTTASAR